MSIRHNPWVAVFLVAALVSGLIFGAVHFFGVPGGVAGVFMALLLRMGAA